MTTFQFSTLTDSTYIAKRDAEKHRLYYKPRTWLVHQRDTTPISIYGEPGEITAVENDDGSTSIPSERLFESLGSDFVANGVQVNDFLDIINQPCTSDTSNQDDNGRYIIEEIVDLHTLKVTEEWPSGSLDSLDFKVFVASERYIEFSELVPFFVKLNPTEKLLDKYGINEKRDCMIELSYYLCQEIVLNPKIGDRFIINYGTRSVTDDTDRDITYEVKNLFEADQLGDSGYPLHLVGFATRIN